MNPDDYTVWQSNLTRSGPKLRVLSGTKPPPFFLAQEDVDRKRDYYR
jgi:hypothetical protein